MRILTRTVAFAILAVAPQALKSQQPADEPQVVHAQLTTQPTANLAQTLDSLKRQNKPLWIGYSIPVIDKFSSGWSDNRIAYLEADHESGTYNNGAAHPSFDHANVLLRAGNGTISKLRLEAPDRQLDAGGLPLVWLTGVNPDQSVQTLVSLVSENAPKRLTDAILLTISVHQSTASTPSLARFATTGNDTGLREKAAFWLASQHGHEGFRTIQHLARTDPDPQFRKKLTFDLSLSKEPMAMTELIRMAHEDSSPEVRRQAQFWMATRGGKLVAGDLRKSAETDPNEQVRKSAVFALSRLPSDEAVAQLIQVADTSKDPVVRKQAVFWLGQSTNPSALNYLTKLLQR